MAYYLQINNDEKVLIGHFTETLNDVVPSDVTGADIYYRLDIEALASDNPSVDNLFGVFQSYIKQVAITSIKIYQDNNVIYQTDKYNHIYEAILRLDESASQLFFTLHCEAPVIQE